MNHNIRIAILIVIATVFWLASGVLSTQSKDHIQSESVALTKVQVEAFSVRKFMPEIRLRSFTAPFRVVDLKAEISGSVVAVPGRRGSLIEGGQVVCALDEDDTQQQLDQSRAQLQQAEIAFTGAQQLKTAGFQSELAIAEAKANLEATKLAFKRSEINAQNIKIKAPFTAIVERRPVEVGDFLAVGQLCARLVELSPLKIIAQVSEADVAKLKLGDRAVATFEGRQPVEANLTYIAHEANAMTRNYLVEAKTENADLALRAGISATLSLNLPAIEAHLIPSSLILLDADGDTVVRAVDKDNVVLQLKVKTVGEDKNGVWVQGLPDAVNLITVGQNYVSQGQQIEIYFSADL